MTENTTIADAMEEDPETLPEEAVDDVPDGEDTYDEDHVQRTISESADKIRLKTKLTRGTGTRDQEAIEVKIKGDDPDETVETLNETLENLAETADNARAIQPGEADDE